MTADLLREAGEALYGSQWQSDMARKLEVAVRTIQRWASGATEIPPGAWLDIAALIQDREALLPRIKIKVLEGAQPTASNPAPGGFQTLVPSGPRRRQ